MNKAGEARLHSPGRSTFEALVVQMQTGVVEKNWALSVDQCLQFSVRLVDLPRILVGRRGFAGMQKAVVNQPGSRPADSALCPFSGAGLTLAAAWCFSVQPLSWLSPVSV